MAAKKTFNIETFKTYINNQLKRTDPFADDSLKAGLCVVLEIVLAQAHAYKGYQENYWVETGYELWIAAGKPEGASKDIFRYGPSGDRYNRKYY